MANEIEFYSGYVNTAEDRHEDVITMDITPYLRGVSEGYKFDYNYFNSNSNNTNFSNHTLYTTFTNNTVPASAINVPDFMRVRITRAQMISDYDANKTYQLLWLPVGEDSNGHKYGVFMEFWFTGKNGNLPGSIDHLHIRWGLRSGTASYEVDYVNEDIGFLNPGSYDPFISYGCGYVTIDDPTVPEDRRVVFCLFAGEFRPNSNMPYNIFPTPLGLYQSTTSVRTTCTPWVTSEVVGNPQYSGMDWTRVKFIDVPKMIGALNLTPDLQYLSDFSPEAGPSSDEDGMKNPSFDDSSDSIDIPDDPTIGVSNVGFVNVYKTGTASLQNIGVELFPALNYTPPTPIASGSTTDAIIDGFNAIVSFLANVPSFFEQSVAATLINYIIDCHVIPVTPEVSTSSVPIQVGYKQLTTSAPKVTKDYVTFDCGSINLSEYYENFADFLTSAKLFLPFVGFVPARPEWFYRDSLNVTYKFNVIDGSFMAYVRSTGKYVNNNNSGETIVGQYSGNACIHLPITGVTYSNMVSGLVGAGAGAVASAGNGAVAGVATSALNAATLRGDMPSSNAYSSSGSFMSVRRPFLMIERPVSNYSKTYAHEIGIPSNISVKLSSVRGFAVVGDVHLDGITATDEEKKELETILSKGVIF